MKLPANAKINTGETGILAICDCKSQNPTDELFAIVNARDDRGVVLVRRNGDVTNRYADGVAGVIEKDRVRAENESELYCPGCENYVRGWIDTE